MKQKPQPRRNSVRKFLIVCLLLLVGGTYTFSQTPFTSQLPIGSKKMVDEYIAQNLDYVSVEIDWYDREKEEWRIFCFLPIHTPGVPIQDPREKVINLLKESLDDITVYFDLGFEGQQFIISIIGAIDYSIIYYNKGRKPFTLSKNAQGEWFVPPEHYEVNWQIQPLGLIPFKFTGLEKARMALQNDDGSLNKVYDTVEDFGKWGANVGVYRYSPIDAPSTADILYVRYDIACSGAPGLITVTTKDVQGNLRNTLVNLQDGRFLKSVDLKVVNSTQMRSMSIPAAMVNLPSVEMITVAGNPEKDLVVECTSDLRAPRTWEIVGYVPKTTIGALTFYREASNAGFFRIR